MATGTLGYLIGGRIVDRCGTADPRRVWYLAGSELD
jgi:hypothetical protein